MGENLLGATVPVRYNTPDMMQMQPNASHRKAWLYAKHRWDYPLAAIGQIIETSALGETSAVADIGSGPGVLARHFLPVAKTVVAVEPDAQMRHVADDQLGPNPNFRCIRGWSHATGLPDQSVDLLTCGMSSHWFDPASTVKEFDRILRPGGWIAILKYRLAEDAVSAAIAEALSSFQKGIIAANAPPEAFIAPATERCFSYTTPHREDRERFIGAHLAMACAPEESDPAFHGFRDRVAAVFDRYAKDGLLHLTQQTDVRIGRLSGR